MTWCPASASSPPPSSCRSMCLGQGHGVTVSPGDSQPRQGRDGGVRGWMEGCVDGGMHGCMLAWMDGWRDAWMEEQGNQGRARKGHDTTIPHPGQGVPLTPRHEDRAPVSSFPNTNLTPYPIPPRGSLCQAAISPTAVGTAWHPMMLPARAGPDCSCPPVSPHPPLAGWTSLTHPHVSETSHAEFLVEADGFPHYLPGVLS